MMRYGLQLTIAVLGICLAVLGGCFNLLGKGTTETTKFYVLHSLFSSGNTVARHAPEAELAVGVGPLSLPQYLKRPQIVIRSTRNQLHISEFHRWAEPLADNIVRVLGENLSILLATPRIHDYPWKRSTPLDYRVVPELSRFDAAPHGDALLRARWTLYDERQTPKRIILQRNAEIREAVNDADYPAMVEALSRVLEELSREFALAIRQDVEQ